MIYEYEFIPRFSDFDRLNMVHHSVYLKYIEEARIEAFEKLFNNKLEKFLNEISNIIVSDVNIKYMCVINKRIQYKVVLNIDGKSGVYILFHFMITDENNVIYTKGYVKVCFVDQKGYLMLAFPEAIKKYFE